MSNDVLRILRAADELLADESRWTQKWYARDADGNSASLDSAVCWCLSGAIQKVMCGRSTFINQFHDVCHELNVTCAAPSGFVAWQDYPERTFVEVKALLRRTIERVEAESE